MENNVTVNEAILCMVKHCESNITTHHLTPVGIEHAICEACSGRLITRGFEDDPEPEEAEPVEMRACL